MHTSLSAPAYLRVRQRMLADISGGAWPIGAHLTLAELERRYGVSQSPIREALLHLAGDGVLVLRAHRGAALPALERAALGELYAVRGALQALTAREAALRATPATLATLAAAARAYEAAPDNPAQITAANREFHAAIDAMSGNRMAIAMLESRAVLVDAVRRACGYGAGRRLQAIRQHRALAAAIARGDAESAARLAHAHAMASWRDLEPRLPEEDMSEETDAAPDPKGRAGPAGRRRRR